MQRVTNEDSFLYVAEVFDVVSAHSQSPATHNCHFFRSQMGVTRWLSRTAVRSHNHVRTHRLMWIRWENAMRTY